MITSVFKKLFNAKDEAVEGGSDNTETRKARIYNLIIVDESGSMDTIARATMGGVNETIGAIRSAQETYRETQEHFLTLVTFDSNITGTASKVLINRQPIDQVGAFTKYNPNGCTALYDAMGESLTTLHDAIKDDEEATGVVTVLTDGYENDSQHWNEASVKALVERLKEEGWTFSYMGSDHDVASVSAKLAIDCHVEFGHDEQGMSSTWERENSARENYYRRMNDEYEAYQQMVVEDDIAREEWRERKRQLAKEYYSDRVTPFMIEGLEPHEVFVFGSNVRGHHDGGAAGVALHRFGASYGQAEGLQGQSYAIPTVGVSLHDMARAVRRFVAFAAQHPERRFLVTRIGCGNAGRSPREIAPLFRDCIKLENIALPADFWQALGLNM